MDKIVEKTKKNFKINRVISGLIWAIFSNLQKSIKRLNHSYDKTTLTRLRTKRGGKAGIETHKIGTFESVWCRNIFVARLRKRSRN